MGLCVITGVDDELWPGAVHRPTTLFHRVFRNTVTRESCRKLTDWNSASRYNGYSAWIDRSGSRPPTHGMHTPGAHTRAAAARSSLKSFSARAVRTSRVPPENWITCPVSEDKGPFSTRPWRFRVISRYSYPLWGFLLCGKIVGRLLFF